MNSSNVDMKFDVNTIQRFSVKIRFNVQMYMDLYSYFIQNNQFKITEYFTVRNAVPDPYSFMFLQELIVKSNIIDSLVSINKDSFNTIDEWELLDFLEDIKINLLTISNTSKFTRSSKDRNSWKVTGVQVYRSLGQYETLEDVALKELASDNWDDDWVGIAMSNNVSEIDYDTEGGNVLEIDRALSYTNNLFLNSVVDTLVGENLYGKDINKKFKFVNDDVDVLSPTNTYLQSVDILINLKRGDIPEFKNMGMDHMIGSSYGMFDYGRIRRQLTQNMNTDDSIRNFNILSFKYNGGDMFLECSADSFYNLNYQENVKIKS